MKLQDFVKDRAPAYLLYAGAFVMILIFMAAFRTSGALMGLAGALFWLAVVLGELWEFSRRRQFYDSLLAQLESLDRKYLISEMIASPAFHEGRLLCTVLQDANKSMCEQVADYRRSVSDFREFIELWVHEVKLPVSSLQLMLHNHPSSITEKALEQLRRIDGFTDTVLYYARSENAEQDCLIKETSLKRTVSNVALKNREDLLLHGIQVQTEHLEFSVMTDGKWLEFILGQLLANSLRYIPAEREGCISVTAEDLPDRTLLHFRDNGIGIPASDLPYIFHKSFTGENGRTHAKSTGMGLYIVQKLCDRLGHGITVQSEQGTFTEFTITFQKHDFYKFG